MTNKKNRYKYDPSSLSFIKITKRRRDILMEVLFFILSSLLFGSIAFSVVFHFVDSPKEKKIKRELNNLLVNYNIINKKINEINSVLEIMKDRDNSIYRVLLVTDSIPSSVRNAGFGGINRYNELKGFDNSQLIMSTVRKTDILAKKLYIQSKSLDEITSLLKNKSKMIASIPAIQPISNKELKRLSSGFGYRTHPIYKVRKMHSGLDFAAPEGTPIYSTGDGIVYAAKSLTTKNRRLNNGYGNVVIIDHGYGYKTLYAHMKEFNVKKGDKVKRGNIIGYVGNTGSSTAPHLHYEVHKNNRRVNPIHFFFNDLSPEEYEEMLELGAIENQSLD
ncbi:M23 family metallopeptidase [Ichthyobacterium seriolicida]|uniref:Peptidase, family M23 n=1 Tax=Ichthyobacterium seriolicida TaxID=242600 RepID=A0A1J1E8J1_9FLAO|nr:M23 family metallopeptidase [Ichthyobacterium seriolicida]BAV94251.1 peptidase, family M23 [Ichthyobacterium seriolicida]